MPRQEGGCPTGMPRNIPSSSTPGNTSPQLGSITRASPRNPLKNLTPYRSAGWKKDLGHILGSFYHYNYPSHKEAQWKKLKTKFFEYLGQHQEEWRAIKKREATPVHALHGEPLLGPHWHQTQGIESIYRVDQAR